MLSVTSKTFYDMCKIDNRRPIPLASNLSFAGVNI